MHKYIFKTMVAQELYKVAHLARTATRRNILILGFFTFLLCRKRAIEASLPFQSSLPFLRGGYISVAPPAPRRLEKEHRANRPRGPAMIDLATLQRRINIIGNRILQCETNKQWTGLHENVGREWGRVTSAIGKLFAREQQQGQKKLDDVISTFKAVLRGNELDTAMLLKACRAHLVLMKTGGAALRLVAKDLESNLNKAEALFKALPKEGRYVASLLENERNRGIHDGNMLKNESAAMGLLWIRRSIAFQLDLYSSLTDPNGKHPTAAAIDAYDKTLSPYHGWLLQKAFPLSLSQMPDREAFIAKFGGIEIDDLDVNTENEIVRKLKTLLATWEPIIDMWKHEFERLDLEDTRPA